MHVNITLQSSVISVKAFFLSFFCYLDVCSLRALLYVKVLE